MQAAVDILEIRKFYRAGFEATENNAAKFETFPLKDRKRRMETFSEFFVNNRSLSETITELQGLSEPLALNWVSALGFHFTKEMEEIKVNQLLLLPTSEKQIIDSYPLRLDKKHLKHYVENCKEELADKNVFIYVCSECGDLGCGGISIIVSKDDKYFEWCYWNDDDETNSYGQRLIFRFDRLQYLKTFEDYLNRRNCF